jgi:hypothetical protein
VDRRCGFSQQATWRHRQPRAGSGPTGPRSDHRPAAPDSDVYDLETSNRCVYFYAYSADGKLTWEGTGHHLYVDPNNAFQSCRDISTPTWKLVGAREIDMGSAFTVYTVSLSGPAPSKS